MEKLIYQDLGDPIVDEPYYLTMILKALSKVNLRYMIQRLCPLIHPLLRLSE